jgi:hypothetical protein
MSFLDRVHFEWWQALIVVVMIAMLPLFKAVAVILIARFVKPGLAKKALPFVFSSRVKESRKVKVLRGQNTEKPISEGDEK